MTVTTVTEQTRARAATRGDAAIALGQVRYELLMLVRTPRRMFFTAALPIMFLVTFSALYGNDPVKDEGGRGMLTLFIPGILSYGLIMATFTSVAAVITMLRDEGVLKRVRGTPVPYWAYMAGHVGCVALASVAMTVIVLAVGVIFGVDVPWHAMPGIVTAVIVGGAAFTALGFGIVAFVKKADSGPMVVNLLILPLSFISGVWGQPPTGTLLDIARIFPVERLAHALQHAYDPAVSGAAVSPKDLLVLAVWAAVGMRLGQRFMRSETANA